MKPVALDLCCGLGGWTAGLLAEGWDVIGFDIERHEYGDKRYPAQLILKSILEINGYDLRAVNPSLVVASPPCQEYSYMAMPWSRAKQIAGAFRGEVPFPQGYKGSLTVAELTALFDACFRIAREIGCPIVLENVKGAQPWVGRANAHYGSYYLWGDVGNVGGRVVRADRPAKFGEYVRPSVAQKFNPDGTAHGQGSWFAIADSKERGGGQKGRSNFHVFETMGIPSPSFHGADHEASVQRFEAIKNDGGSWFNQAHNTESGKGQNPVQRLASLEAARAVAKGMQGTKGTGGGWFEKPYRERGDITCRFNSKSDSRKAASAMIAEIPFPLAQHIAKVFYPR